MLIPQIEYTNGGLPARAYTALDETHDLLEACTNYAKLKDSSVRAFLRIAKVSTYAAATVDRAFQMLGVTTLPHYEAKKKALEFFLRDCVVVGGNEYLVVEGNVYLRTWVPVRVNPKWEYVTVFIGDSGMGRYTNRMCVLHGQHVGAVDGFTHQERFSKKIYNPLRSKITDFEKIGATREASAARSLYAGKKLETHYRFLTETVVDLFKHGRRVITTFSNHGRSGDSKDALLFVMELLRFVDAQTAGNDNFKLEDMNKASIRIEDDLYPSFSRANHINKLNFKG